MSAKTHATGVAMGIDEGELAKGVDRLLRVERPRYQRLWAYYRNPMRVCNVMAGDSGSGRPYRQAQEWGLPSRITGIRSRRDMVEGEAVSDVGRKEVVIENDIGWRVETMVDYLFGKPVVLRSAAADPKRRAVIDRLIRAIVAHNGGILFLQQMALLGSVYGFVDVLVKLQGCSLSTDQAELSARESVACGESELGEPPVTNHAAAGEGNVGESAGEAGSASMASAGSKEQADAAQQAEEGAPGASLDPSGETGAGDHDPHEATIQRLARMVRLEVVEPARALPLLSACDSRVVTAYAQCYESQRTSSNNMSARSRWWERLLRQAESWAARNILTGEKSETVRVVEIITNDRWQRYEDGRVTAEGKTPFAKFRWCTFRTRPFPLNIQAQVTWKGLFPFRMSSTRG